MSGGSEYTGRSIFDAPGAAPAPASPPPAAPPLRGILFTLEGGHDLAVSHEGGVDRVEVERHWGHDFLVFDGGDFVRADKVLRFRVTTLEEAREEADRAPDAVPVVLAGVQQAQAAPQTTLDDLPYSMWPIEALLAEEKRMDPEGIASSSDLDEVRAAIKKIREKK